MLKQLVKRFWAFTYKSIFVEPVGLAVGKEYNLNNLKAVKVTDEFLKLDRGTIGCQNTKSIQDCKTKEYIDSLIKQCKCLPYSMIDVEKVAFCIILIDFNPA